MLGQVLSESDWKHARRRGRTAFVATRVILGAALTLLIGFAFWIEGSSPDVALAFLLGGPGLVAAGTWLQARALWDRCLANYPDEDDYC